MQSPDEIVEMFRSKWGTKTLADFRLESSRQPEGGVFESIREPGGRRIIVFLCVTRPDDISHLEKAFALIDSGESGDWQKLTLLDFFMQAPKEHGSSFVCSRDKSGRRDALIFLAHTPHSISILEKVFGLKS
jgi:hypothetical protein